MIDMTFPTTTGGLQTNKTTPLLLHLNYPLFFFWRKARIQEYILPIITQGLKKISTEFEEVQENCTSY